MLRWLCDSTRTECAWRITPYIYVARASNGKRDCDVKALPILACERLNMMTSVREERLGRMISIVACCRGATLCAHATRDFRSQQKWCCGQDVKVVPSSAFTQRTCDWCGSLWKGGDVVATSPVVLRWLCDSTRTGCAWRITPLCMWREQAIREWSRRAISIVACCHGAKLCAHAARDFRSQHY